MNLPFSLSEQKFSLLPSKYIKSVEILFRIELVSLCCLSVMNTFLVVFQMSKIVAIYITFWFLLSSLFSGFRHDIFHQNPIFTEM